MKIFIIHFLLLFSATSFSQDTIYFDKDWKPSTKNNYSFYRPIPLKKVGDLVLLKDYYKDGTLQFQGYIYPTDEHKYVGDVYWYDNNGLDNGFRQNLNKSSVKELTYYNPNGSVWKKITYDKNGKKSNIVVYFNNKELIKGEIKNHEYIGYFSPEKPKLNYDNPFKKNEEEDRDIPLVMGVQTSDYSETPKEKDKDKDKIYTQITYWDNGKKAKEETISNYTTLKTIFWDKAGKLITENTERAKTNIEYYTRNEFAVAIKSKKKTISTNNSYSSTETEYYLDEKLAKITKQINGDKTEVSLFVDGKENVSKYKDDKPFDGFFSDTIGDNVTIYQMKNGKIIGEVITKNSENNQIIAKGIYKDGTPDNGSFFLNVNDKVQLLQYKNQKQEGVQIIFESRWNNNPEEEFEMKNGLLDGYQKIYKNDSLAYQSEYKNGKPFAGTIIEGNIKEIYENGYLTQKVEFDKNSDQTIVLETYENNQIKTKTYRNFLIKENPQSFYTGIFKNEKPFEGYFINEIILNEIPLVDYYEKGELKYQYSFDFMKQLDNYNFHEYDIKTTFKNGKILDGIEYSENGRNTLIVTGYKDGKPNTFDINIFAMHYFNRISFVLTNNELTIKDLEKNTSIKIEKNTTQLLVSIYDNTGKLITNNQQKETKEATPNSITFYFLENNKLKKEIKNMNEFEVLYDKLDHEINPLFGLIYNAISIQPNSNIQAVFDQFIKVFKSENLEDLKDLENLSFNFSDNYKLISSLRYDENGKPEIGAKITENGNEYLVELYIDKKIKIQKKITSVSELSEIVKEIYSKQE